MDDPTAWCLLAIVVSVTQAGNWQADAGDDVLRAQRAAHRNIGFDLGIISPRLFTILVLMALVTTPMTSPLLRLMLRRPDLG